MQHHIQTLVKQFFRKETLEEVSVDELRQFTAEYPYSAAGQLLFTRKLQQSGSADYTGQAEKSALYFYNPVWSRWLLQDHISSGPLPLERIVHETSVPAATEAAASQPVFNLPANGSPGTVEPDDAPPFTVNEEEQPTLAAGLPVSEPADSVAEPTVEVISEVPAPVEQQQETVTEEMPAAAPVQQPSEPVTAPNNPAAGDDDPAFEPFHTIDYFASQGIKLRLEDLPKDKLGQQLKSFTDWLRSMKRLNTVTDTDSLDEITHQAIQQIADHSISGKEIITEAMAEVWAKQGHRDKATAIYEKLSLLNPAKSSYFAGKIEQLKAE